MGKTIFGFAMGALAGSLITYLLMKDTLNNRINEERQAIEEYYSKTMADKESENVPDLEATKEALNIEKPQDGSEEVITTTKASIDMDEYSKAVDTNNYRSSSYEPTGDNGMVFVITKQQYESDMDFFKLPLLYFVDDGQLVAEDNGDLSTYPLDIEKTIGEESLNHFGEFEHDSVYVRNVRVGIDYHVVRQYTSYQAWLSNGDDEGDD